MKTFNKMRFKSLLLTLLLVVMMAVPTIAMAAQPTVNLGTTSTLRFWLAQQSPIPERPQSTEVLGWRMSGCIQVLCSLGRQSVTVSGAVHLADAVAIKAKDDLVTAYNDAAGRTPVTRIPLSLVGLH